MGRGRQKAKQQKIARKLKYLTTDTDYDELAKELSTQEPGVGSADPFADIEAKATSGEIPVTTAKPSAAAPKPKPAPHKPIPMPVPSALKPKKA